MMATGNQLANILGDHGGWAPQHAFIECMVCGKTNRIEGSKGQSDAALIAQFEKQGWTVGPTRCPKHVGQEVTS